MDFLQSTARRVVLKAYLASDHITPATGVTIAIEISKNGGSFGNPNAGATNATEISDGWYYVDLDTTDTGTLGPIIVRGTEETIDDVETHAQVVSAGGGGLDAAGVRDAIGLASANLDTQLSTIDTVADGIKAVTDTLVTKKNTAKNNFMFTMVNSAGTPRAGVTLTATRSIDGAAFGACTNSPANVGNGWYKINLSAADLNGDVIALRFTGSGVRDRNITIQTHA